jgi:hypothetical protein
MIQSYFLEKSPIIAGHYQEQVEASASDRWDSGFDMSMSRENPTIAAYDWVRFHYKDDEDLIDKEKWDELYARPDTDWYEGMTHYQAEAIRDEYDYNLKANLYNDTDGFNFANTAGYFTGALLDPLNFLPWTRTMASTLRFVSSSAKALKFQKFINPLKSGNITKADDIIDAMIGSSVGEGSIAGRKISHQQDYDIKMSLLNIAMAGSIGAGVAGMKKVHSILKDRSVEETLGSAGKALDDGSNSKPVEVDGSAPPEQQTLGQSDRQGPLDKLQENARKEVEILVNEPTIKAIASTISNTVRKAPKAMVDFINCRIS